MLIIIVFYRYEANDISTAEHCGTHLDAPVHFARNHWSVDQIPPEHFFGPGIILLSNPFSIIKPIIKIVLFQTI